MIRLLLLCCTAQVAPSQPPLVTAPPGEVVLDIKPENAIARLKSRNLFHPTRGVIAPGASAAVILEVPSLVATVITKKGQTALLRWPKAVEAELVDKGATEKGVVLLEVEADRAQIQIVASGEKRWLEFEQPENPAGGAARTGSELERLLVPPKQTPLAPPPSAQQDLTPQSPRALGAHK